MVFKYVNVEVEIDLVEFDDDQLIEELEDRGYEVAVSPPQDLLTSIWMKRRLGKPYDAEVDELIYKGLGKVI